MRKFATGNASTGMTANVAANVATAADMRIAAAYTAAAARTAAAADVAAASAAATHTRAAAAAAASTLLRERHSRYGDRQGRRSRHSKQEFFHVDTPPCPLDSRWDFSRGDNC
jgi:hypothetical protein